MSTKSDTTRDMTIEEKRIIWDFAQGDRRLREDAIAIHRKYVRTLGARGTLEQRYMAEVDHSVPDYGLRERYRCDMLIERGVKDV